MAGLTGLGWLVRGPKFVDHVTLVNRTGLDLDVAVTDPRGDALLPIATTAGNRTARVEDVVDQGDTWVFVVSHAGEHVARLRLTRDELESHRWLAVLPANLEDN
jgi:hypothetical protein